MNSIAINSMAANGSYVYAGFRIRSWHANTVNKLDCGRGEVYGTYHIKK